MTDFDSVVEIESMTKTKLEIVRVFDAPVETVYRAWIDAEILKCWMGPGEVSCKEASAEVRVGGSYRIHMQDPDCEQHIVTGVYSEIAVNSRLSFSWQWEGSESTTHVSVEFKPLDGGKTELTLRHSGFPDQVARDHHHQGWNGCLENLAKALN
ncbi:MAG: SRPBCC domain-containing protein [Gammaproteobacteria bacterium]